MSSFCRILRWICCFIGSTALSQSICLLPWGYWIVMFVGFGNYAAGYQSNSWLLQVIAAGIMFGGIKCYFGG